jgi:tetratricopeptide (TPR) repeat protein
MNAKVFNREYLEEYLPILLLATDRLIDEPRWSIRILDSVVNKLVLPILRQERKVTTSLIEAIHFAERVVFCIGCEVADRLELAHLLAKAERLEEALIHIQTVIDLEPDVADHHRFLASMFERMKQFTRAEEAIEVAIQLRPDYLELLADRMRIRAQVRNALIENRNNTMDRVLAIELTKKLIECYDGGVVDRLELAHLLVESERLEEALIHIQTVINLEPNLAEHYQFQGIVLERLARYRSAMRAIHFALCLSPYNMVFKKDLKRIRNLYYLHRLGLSKLSRYVYN